ncbi:MAG: Lrp/AsnC family transcriptional regulator, partial [Candidatus Woesearchaeota archaeon]|nr:Lrp/AsnC family transcriptional regulator [Candidatus Woesearchaeota archaeon]
YISVMTQIYYFKHKYLLQKYSEEHFLLNIAVPKIQLTSEQLKLIKLLNANAALTLIELSQQLKISTKTTRKIMKELEQQKVILGYTTKINHKALGFTQRKVMLSLNDTSQKSMQKIITFLTAHTATIYITLAIGQYDLEFEMMEQGHEDFHELLKQLKNTFPELIKNYFTVIFYNELKSGIFTH